MSCPGCNAAIEALGILESYEWQPGGNEFEIWTIKFSGIFGLNALYYVNARIVQGFISIVANDGIGIAYSAHDSDDSGGNYGVGAGRRFAEMRAGFKGGDKGGPARVFAGYIQGFDFGVRQTGSPMISFANYPAILK